MNSRLIPALLFLSALSLAAETEDHINKRLPVHPVGKLVVDVDFGSIDVTTNASNEVTLDMVRTVTRSSKAAEEAFLNERPVTVTQEGDTVTIRSRGPKMTGSGWWGGIQRTEGKYTVTVPATFQAQLKTSGGGIAVNDLNGEVKAATSGGSLRFNRLRGPLDGGTSGGGIHLTDCQGSLKIRTSGGGIDVMGGSGSLDGHTSGGSVTVREFRGSADVGSSGGGITIENVSGKVAGSTSGGSVNARFSAPLTEEVRLETSGGGVTLRAPENSAFTLEASTSGGGVSSELPVTITGKAIRDQLKGPVNGGGKMVYLHSSGGSIHVKKL